MLKPIAPILLAIFAFSILYIPAPNERAALACQCNPPKPVDQAFSESAAVFSGRVEGIASDDDPVMNNQFIEFTVDKAWKGLEGDRKSVTLVTPEGEASCGYPFEGGRGYLVYSYDKYSDELFEVNMCSATKSIDRAGTDIAILDTLANLPIIGIGAAIGGAVVFFSLRKLGARKAS